MKVTGIIAEYNPFHEGHAYQLKTAKSMSDAVIVIMSGCFVQRGDVAIYDKFKRAEVALKNGADLVIELPVVFSSSTAERFAYGGVCLLHKTNIVDFLLFGSESGDLKALESAAEILENEPESVSLNLKNLLNEGLSYPKAREIAYKDFIEPTLLSSPNNILGIEYIRQLIRLNSKIKPVTLKRQGAGYHDKDFKKEFPSATALRSAIINEDFSYEPFKNDCVHTLKNLETAIIYNIRKNKEMAFSNIFDVSEGIENRLVRAASEYSSIEDIINHCTTKRYTRTKLQRILIASLLGINSELSKQEPEYIRVLGTTETGFSLINKIKELSALKIITKVADFKDENKMFEKDILATDIFDLSSSSPQGAGRDFKTTPIILRSTT